MTETITVTYPGDSYPIYLGENILAEIGTWLATMGFKGTCGLVTNRTVGDYHAETALNSLIDAGFQPTLCEIPDGEAFKTLETVANLYDQFLTAGLERQSPILALGGGVVGDTAGFAAATYLRGVPFVQIPTSLLAMVDASVGGKTGVDLPQGKNLVGAFKQPQLVVVDAAVLQTLPQAEFRAGMAEVVKAGIIANPTLFTALAENDYTLPWMLAEAIKVKVAIVEEDPYEKGRRAVLNLGHTFGHAFEQRSDYALRHGEAIGIGLICAARLAVQLDICSTETERHICNLLEAVGLPLEIPPFPWDDIWQLMQTDKKKQGGQVRFILPVAIGEVDIFDNIPESAVKSSIL